MKPNKILNLGSLMKSSGMFLAVGLILLFGIGSTYSLLVSKSDQVVNSFSQGVVSVEIMESFDGQTKRDVTVANTGNVSAYVRAAILVTWRDASGNIIGKQPELGTDYTLELNRTDWFMQDGFFYHRAPVGSGEVSSVLIQEARQLRPNANSQLSIEILGSGIQSTPSLAVEEAWNVAVVNHRWRCLHEENADHSGSPAAFDCTGTNRSGPACLGYL